MSRKRNLLPSALLVCLLPSCGAMMTKPQVIGPHDIYAFEKEHYPSSSWVYLGSTRNWHYFDRYPHVFDLSDYKLPRRYLPDFKGYRYKREKHKSTSADVEIHEHSIRIHIDDEAPAYIPFKSPGFTTAQRRPKSRRLQVIADGEDITDELEKTFVVPPKPAD